MYHIGILRMHIYNKKNISYYYFNSIYLRKSVLSLYNVLYLNIFVVFSEINIFSLSINSSNLFYNAF